MIKNHQNSSKFFSKIDQIHPKTNSRFGSEHYVNQNLCRSSAMVDTYGMTDFGCARSTLGQSVSELEHYTALQKLSGCASAAPVQCLQSSGGSAVQSSGSAAYRMNASTAPLYAMSSLSYSDWTGTNAPISGAIRNTLITNNPGTLTSPTAPITKGQSTTVVLIR